MEGALYLSQQYAEPGAFMLNSLKQHDLGKHIKRVYCHAITSPSVIDNADIHMHSF